MRQLIGARRVESRIGQQTKAVDFNERGRPPIRVIVSEDIELSYRKAGAAGAAGRVTR